MKSITYNIKVKYKFNMSYKKIHKRQIYTNKLKKENNVYNLW